MVTPSPSQILNLPCVASHGFGPPAGGCVGYARPRPSAAAALPAGLAVAHSTPDSRSDENRP